MRSIYRILALSCACFNFASCAKSSNTIKTSLIIPSGAPTLAAYKILTNSDVFDAEVRADATTIPAEFSLGNDKTAILISKNIVKDTLSLPTAFRTRYKQDISFSTK